MHDLPYRDAQEHLRDELLRVWLRVEYQIRLGWELGRTPPRDEPDHLAPSAADIAALFTAAHADYAGQRVLPADSSARRVLEAFLAHSARVEARVRATLEQDHEEGRDRQERPVPLPLEILRRCFGLSRWQQAALCFALMPEVDPGLLVAYRYLSRDPACLGLDGRLLAALVYDTLESRTELARDLAPTSPLLRYRLLDTEEGQAPLLYRRLRPAARLVAFLAGGAAMTTLCPQLDGLARLPPPPVEGLFPAALLSRAVGALRGGRVALVLQGARGVGKRHLARLACAAAGQRALLIDGGRAGRAPRGEEEALARALVREAKLLSCVPIVTDLDDALPAGQPAEGAEVPPLVRALCEEHEGPLGLTLRSEKLPRVPDRPVVHLPVPLPGRRQRGRLWQGAVPTLAEDEALALADRFAVPGGVIVSAAQAGRAAGAPTVEALDQAVRAQLQDRLGRLGRRLDTPHTFDDLVVSQEVLDVLWEVLTCVRERRRVREEWGFHGPPGVSVLFSGSPGVGKTMSATVLARELGLAAFELDLSAIVSKWVGETEKNLAEVFDAAEPGHVVLLFNEADSLFGKRTTDVKTANDRYANLETNFLLQRLERFGGLAILTTNLGKAIDPAFRRRFAYDVQFTFPTAEQRAELWQRGIPARARGDDLRFDVLGESFQLSGGLIKMAVQRSAIIAAALERKLDMEILTNTVERMYLERGMIAAVGPLE